MYVLGKPTGGSLLASIQPRGYLGFAGVDAHCVGFETDPPRPAQPGRTWPLHKPVLVEIWEPSKGAQGVTGDEHDLASHLAKERVLTQGDQASHFDPLILLAGQLVLTVA